MKVTDRNISVTPAILPRYQTLQKISIGSPVCHHGPETYYKSSVPWKRKQLSGITTKENRMIEMINIIFFAKRQVLRES